MVANLVNYMSTQLLRNIILSNPGGYRLARLIRCVAHSPLINLGSFEYACT